jgi:hypothetical protein
MNMNKERISNIRYGPPGTIEFDLLLSYGETLQVSIAEPRDVLLVGWHPEPAAAWIEDHYGMSWGGGKVAVTGKPED